MKAKPKPQPNYTRTRTFQQKKNERIIEEIVGAVTALGECTFPDVFNYLWPERLREIYQTVNEESLRMIVYECLHTLGTQGDRIQRTGKTYQVIKR